MTKPSYRPIVLVADDEPASSTIMLSGALVPWASSQREEWSQILLEETSMLKAVEGVYRQGKIELLEVPPDVKEARVVVTFLSDEGAIDLRACGISAVEAAELRSRWGAGAEDWDRPEMDVYNDL